MTAGSAGSGKTFVDLGLLHILCCNINGLRLAVIRKSEKNLKQTTIPSYNKMKRITKSFDDSFITDFSAKYPSTGSEILFIWADISKDPDLDNIKGLELDGALIEEANQIDQKYFELLKTRIGRWSNKIKPFILLNCNPSANWVKDMFYDPWANNTLPKDYYFLQFEVFDNEDNLSGEYIKGLESLPEEEYKRYVKNVWEYSDNPNQLIKYEWYKQCLLDVYEPPKVVHNLLACDVAREGNDRTVIGRMANNHMGYWKAFKKQDTTVTGNLIKLQRKDLSVDPKDVIIDAIGVGGGVIDTCRHGEDKFSPTQFIAGKPSKKKEGIFSFFNLRTQAYWELREALKKEVITVEHHPSLQKELLCIEYTSDEKTFRVMPKAKMKSSLGFSPDYGDTAMMLIWRYINHASNMNMALLNKQLNPVSPVLKNAKGSARALRERQAIRRRQEIAN